MERKAEHENQESKNSSNQKLYKDMALAPTVRAYGGKTQHTVRTGRFAIPQKQKRTKRFDRHAFLKQEFAPLLSDFHDELFYQKEIEKGFYCSAKNLCKLYGWEEFPLSPMPYPFNLAVGMDILRERLKIADGDLDIRLLQDSNFPARIATVKTCPSGSVLFYLPVAPMLRLIEKKESQIVGELLLSVYAYLFQVVGIEHFAGEESYLGYTYAMLEDWWDNDEDYQQEDKVAHDVFFSELWERGKVSLMMMAQRENFELFAHRMECFSANTTAEWEFEETAREIFALYQQYPARGIGGNIFPPFGNDGDEATIRVEQYMHFFWDFNEMVHDQFMDCINAELNECCLIDEPTTLQYFDVPQSKDTHDHDFETRLFALLHELSDNIIDLSHE
ncbi:hypothetical protein GM921_09550 [Pedobacter sp. LMG 31464]|uniref:Uncharacterized protein n=1 Tax=Pedobacter planticolens TaxID=2679964 RepID=A0A923DZZ5_9SPHI|nr:hypothetical protein [Pedobacter planticolens]MBB2145730.1 hypothetical protein [Pedobacter planticolens]